jgi:hypothetical protein
MLQVFYYFMQIIIYRLSSHHWLNGFYISLRINYNPVLYVLTLLIWINDNWNENYNFQNIISQYSFCPRLLHERQYYCFSPVLFHYVSVLSRRDIVNVFFLYLRKHWLYKYNNVKHSLLHELLRRKLHVIVLSFVRQSIY